MEKKRTNQPEGVFRTPKNVRFNSSHSISGKPGVIVRKKDGTVIVPNTKEPDNQSSKPINILLPVFPERELTIRQAVKSIYLELDIPALAKELKSYRKEVLALDRDNAPDMSPVYVFGSLDKKSKQREIQVKLTYSGVDNDGQTVLMFQETAFHVKTYIKSTPDGSLLFSENKRTGRGPKESFRPYSQARNSKAGFGTYSIMLKYLKARGLSDCKFYNLVKKLKIKYVNAITIYFIFLEQHGLSQRVDQMIECAELEQPQLQIPFFKFRDEKTNDNNDDAQSSDINSGDKICCKLSSVVSVLNTFQCLDRQHHMVSVVLEILIKNADEDMPFTKELQAYYCKECHRIFMYTSEYEKIRGMVDDSHYFVFNRFNVDGVLFGRKNLIGTGWADESILKEAGYEVNQKSSLTQQQRLSILISLNRRGLSYHTIISYLNTFINVLGASSTRDMTQAVNRWQEDINALKCLQFTSNGDL